VGHAWFRAKFIVPFQRREETDTRFIPARVADNRFNNPDYKRVLESLTGWQRRAWLDGDWDIAAGQFFTTFRRDVHVIDSVPEGPTFDERRAVEWFAALDYGFTHYTVVLLGCKDGDGNLFIVDEHAERLWLPQRHAEGIKAMVARHRAVVPSRWLRAEGPETRTLELSDVRRFSAGTDVFSRQGDGTTVAQQYQRLGINLKPASMDRLNGWAEVMQGLGEVAAPPANEPVVKPKLFIHRRCKRLVETLPALQHDPNRPEDVLKVDADDDGVGGDDAADCLRYLVSSKIRELRVVRLRGF
jgi:phage terminase large subunit